LISIMRSGREVSVLSTGSAGLLGLSGLGDEALDTEVLDEGLEYGVLVDFDVVDLDLGSLGDEIHLSLALLFLESEGDASDGALGDSLHQVGGVTSNLVSESLGLDDGDIVDDSLVDVEVVGQPKAPNTRVRHIQINSHRQVSSLTFRSTSQ